MPRAGRLLPWFSCFAPGVMEELWLVGMPPPGAGKQSDGDEKEQKPVGRFAGFEYQKEQYYSDQAGASGRQVMCAEVTEKLFNFIEVHGFSRVDGLAAGTVVVT